LFSELGLKLNTHILNKYSVGSIQIPFSLFVANI